MKKLIIILTLLSFPSLAHDKPKPEPTPPPTSSGSDHESFCDKYCKPLGILGLIGVGIYYAPKGTNDVKEDRQGLRIGVKPNERSAH